jgi:hypothetical protein
MNASGEIDHSGHHEIFKLLEGENIGNFLAIKNGIKFEQNFVDIEKLNAAENDIFIEPNTDVIISGDAAPEFSTILIEGTLRIHQTGQHPLKVQKIIISPTGKLVIGTQDEPILPTQRVEIIFSKTQSGEIGIFVFGELTIYGDETSPTFVGLVGDVKQESTSVTVDRIVKGWNKGDKVVLASPNSRYDAVCAMEESEISKISGVIIELAKPLQCDYKGVFSKSKDLPRTHISNLSRNVIIKSEDAAARGSVNFFYGSKGSIYYAEFNGLGPKDVLGRYPIHFHHMMDTSRGIQVVGNSIVNSDNRWVTIHDSNGILVRNNVGYKSVGHGYFLETGSEFENVFENNMGIFTNNGELTKFDTTSAVFWIQNPYNIFRDNVATQGAYYGFYFNINNTWAEMPNTNEIINLRSLPTLEFENNLAYANNHAGLKIVRPLISETNMEFLPYLISKFTVWNVANSDPIPDNGGIFIEGHNVTIINSVIHDSPIGIFLGGSGNVIDQTTITNTKYEKTNLLYSGIIVGGQNNIIQNSKIEGYATTKQYRASDISLSEEIKTMVSALVINTKLLDQHQIIFGHPFHVDSFLIIDKNSVRNSPTQSHHGNIMLKRSDYASQNANEEFFYDEHFDAVVTLVNGTTKNFEVYSADPMGLNAVKTNRIKSIKELKNNAYDWLQNALTNIEFTNDVMYFIRVGVVPVKNIDLDDVESYDLVVPVWIKDLVELWIKGKISDNDFINALRYILESQIASSNPYR